MKAIAKYLASIGSKGGKATSKAKSKAAKANGKKGGRPKKTKHAETPSEPANASDQATASTKS